MLIVIKRDYLNFQVWSWIKSYW